MREHIYCYHIVITKGKENLETKEDIKVLTETKSSYITENDYPCTIHKQSTIDRVSGNVYINEPRILFRYDNVISVILYTSWTNKSKIREFIYNKIDAEVNKYSWIENREYRVLNNEGDI